MDKTYRVGLNRNFVGKPARTERINYAEGWIPSQVTLDELMAHVRSGFSFSAHYESEYRKSANFICADVLAADFDGTMTWKEALADDYISQYAAFLYTTPSHTDQSNRFRAVFLLEDTITSAKDWADCLFGLAIHLDADRSIKDAGRMFFGSPGCQIVQIGKKLPPSEVTKLINLGRLERSRSRHPATAGAAITAASKLKKGQVIQLRDGRSGFLSDLPVNTSVCCPFHADEHPSAFVLKSSKGTKGIHCMACNATYWSGDTGQYDFSAFDRLVDERSKSDKRLREVHEQSTKNWELGNPFAALFPPEPTVFIHQQKFLPPLSYAAGITAIKSPKGSGKTEALAALIDQIRHARFVSGVKKEDAPKSVLLIGHRQSLIKEAADRLGLDCYLDDEKKGTHRDKRFGYAICLDSLYKIALGAGKRTKPAKYDVIIIDESEQVVSHLLSETLRERAGITTAFASLEFMIRQAKAVFALDADLGLITLHALQALRPVDWEHSLRIIHNKPLEAKERRSLLIYQSKKDLQNRLLTAIRDGKRCFVASNAKSTVEILEQMIRKDFGETVKMITITSENSRGATETHFVQNIQTEFLKKQVLICSPSLGTGIDISFPDGRQEVDEVIGFFSSQVNKHTDIDQQLSRVRNPGAVSVWFDAGQTNFETHLDVIKSQIAAANYIPTALTGKLDEYGVPSYNQYDPLLNIAAHVMVAHRSSQNRIRALFEELRKSHGWDIIAQAKAPSASANRRWKDAQTAVREKRISGILSAKDLSDSEFIEMADDRARGKPLRIADRYALEKYELQQAYGRAVDRNLIEMDRQGKLRLQIEKFRQVLGEESFFMRAAKDVEQDIQSAKPLTRMPVDLFVGYAMVAAGLIVSGNFVEERILRAGSLDVFKAWCTQNRVMIEEIIRTSLREDYQKNPIRQLNAFLSIIGLKLKPMDRKRRKGSASILYKIDNNSLTAMRKYASNFKN